MITTEVRFLGMTLKNPLVLPSGILDTDLSLMMRMASEGAGMIITKSITMRPREGYPGPTILEPVDGAVLNAMGLPNPGIEAFRKWYVPEIEGIPLVPSIFGHNEKELESLAEELEPLKPPAIEINLSCPHAGGGVIAQDPEATEHAVGVVADSSSAPVIAKLSPNVTDIVEIAASAIQGGASAISAINTLEAMEIDVEFERPALGHKRGGLSGPCIRPIALRKVADVALSMQEGIIPDVPIIGLGGVSSGEDVIRFILAGATCVGIGSALLHSDLSIFRRVLAELEDWMKKKGYVSLDEFRGNALHHLR